jgi:hypothetical protein
MTTEPDTPHTGRLDRAAVMSEARRQYQIMGPLGWTFAKCLAYSWSKIKRRAALAQSVDAQDDAGNDSSSGRFPMIGKTPSLDFGQFRLTSSCQPSAAQRDPTQSQLCWTSPHKSLALRGEGRPS